jgi:hypothetical protein
VPVDGLNIEIVCRTPLRRLILDPTKDYRRIPRAKSKALVYDLLGHRSPRS